MYTAKVYTVSIVSPRVTIEEEHIARETLNRWNATFGKEKAKIYLPLPSDSTAEPDIYVLPIDNYVDTAKAKTTIATGKPVILLFSEYHNDENTIPAELKDVEALKNEKASNCVKATYNGRKDHYDYTLVAGLMKYWSKPFQYWRYEIRIVYKQKAEFPGLTNDSYCPCGSGKTYGECCSTNPDGIKHRIYTFMVEPIN